MKTAFSISSTATSYVVFAVAGGLTFAPEQAAVDGCIDQLRAVGGPDARAGGEVTSTEFSEAGTLVMLRDAGGTVWRCIGYADGAVGELSVVESADNGGRTKVGAGGEPITTTERVRFQRGASGAELAGALTPGSSTRYVLGADNGRFFYVRLAAQGPDLYYQIFNPDRSFLLDQMTSHQAYRGQLWQSGDHVIEVINRGSVAASYNVIFGIE